MTDSPDPGNTSSEQRERLLAGLAESIREKGLVATQVTDIVRHARASRSTFYNVFPNKDACFLELARTVSERVLEHLQQSIDPNLTLKELVDSLVGDYFAVLASDPAMTIAFGPELTALGPDGQRVRLESLTRYAKFVQRVGNSAAERERGSAPVTEAAAIMAVGGIHDVVNYASFHEIPLEEFAADVKATVLAMLSPVGSSDHG